MKPRLRGVLHEAAFYLALACAAPLVASAPTTLARVAGAVFATAVATMFGSSALYHRVTWPHRVRRWLGRLDHAAIYLLIGATYTPACLLVLRDEWRIGLLVVVWSASLVAGAVKAIWYDAPKWTVAAAAVGVGAIGVVALPQLARIGPAGLTLLVAGGVLYTLGAVVYALRRPDPAPATFGYHELFHALVVAAVVCDYVAVAFWILPRGA